MSANSSATRPEIALSEGQVLISRADLAGRINYANAELIEVSGYSEAELMGQPHKLLRHPDMPAQVFADLWRDIRAGRPWIGILQNRCKDGSSYWVEAHVSPLREGRVIVGYIAIRRPATQGQIARARALYAEMRAGSLRQNAFVHGQRADNSAWGHLVRRWAGLSLTWKFLVSALSATLLLLSLFGSLLGSQLYGLLDQNDRYRLAHDVGLLRTAFESAFQHELEELTVSANRIALDVRDTIAVNRTGDEVLDRLDERLSHEGGSYFMSGSEAGSRATLWRVGNGVLLPLRANLTDQIALHVRAATDSELLAGLAAGEVRHSVQFNQGNYYLLLFQPLTDPQGKILGVLVLCSDLSVRFSFLIDRFRHLELGEGGYYYVLDARPGPQFGRLIMHPFKEGRSLVQLPGANGGNVLQDMRRKDKGLLNYQWMNEEAGETVPREKLVAYENVPGLHWIVVGGAAVNQFSALSSTVASTVIGGVLTMVVAIFLIIFALVRRLVLTPIREEILPCFQAIAEGEYATQLDVRGQDEMSSLVQGLESLQNRRAFEAYQAEAFAVMREQAQQAAEELSRSRTEFLANMSHEIRTPMNAVIGLTYLLQRSDLGERELEYVRRIESSGQLLLSIINDILDFSKIDADRLLLENRSFRLDDVLENLSVMMRPRAQEKQLLLEYVVAPGVPAELCGDPLRLTQILINLVSNAIKFTARGSVIVFVSQQARRDERLEIEFRVQDTGIGMSAEQIEKLFKPFSQADSSMTRRFGGTGLGLVICKRLIELMDGEIWVDSQEAVGSTFSFNIWLDKVTEASQVPMHQKSRVLVVDDHELSRSVLVSLLTNLGHEAISVDSGDAALALLLDPNQPPVDEVLTDLLMPGMDGVELNRLLRASVRYPLKIVLVTTADTSASPDAERLQGFDAVLEKPVTAHKIGETLAYLKRGGSLPATVRQPIAAEAVLAGMSILVAEDVPTNQLIIRDLLESLGATVYIADHGEAALRSLKSLGSRLDLVLMDIQMPVMDGLEATRQIRAGNTRADVPIVALTANVFPEERARATAAGMNDFLIKPIEPQHLIEVLQRWRPRQTGPADAEHGPAPVAVNRKDEAFPALPGIDTVDGLRRMMNRQPLYEKVLQDFYLRFQGETERIREALASGDMESAIRRAHSLKGTGGTIGARRLAECAKAVEFSLREQTQNSGHEAALCELASALDEVLAGIADCFPGLSPLPA